MSGAARQWQGITWFCESMAEHDVDVQSEGEARQNIAVARRGDPVHGIALARQGKLPHGLSEAGHRAGNAVIGGTVQGLVEAWRS